jgi:spermidine synthase
MGHLLASATPRNLRCDPPRARVTEVGHAPAETVLRLRAVKPWKTLARAGALSLHERDGEHVIRARGVELMSSRRRRSEEAMAELAAGAKSVLIGGLGLGFTLRATLGVVDARARVVVAELSSAVVEWAPLVGAPIGDPKVTVIVGDVAEVDGRFDAILLDVDNGPVALTHERNARLYGPAGIARFKARLSRRGVLAVWSAGPDAKFLKALGRAGFAAESISCGPHALLVGRNL